MTRTKWNARTVGMFSLAAVFALRDGIASDNGLVANLAIGLLVAAVLAPFVWFISDQLWSTKHNNESR